MWEPILITGIVFLTVYSIIKLIIENNARNKMIDKGVQDFELKKMFTSQLEIHSLSSIKWGMVLVGIGIAVLARQIFPRSVSDDGMLGLIFLFAGIGFLAYYPLVGRRIKEIKARQKQESNM